MADFSALKTSIQNYIKQNGNNEITGAILQQILLSMVTALGDNAINDLVTALGDEVAARQNADGTLQDNIDDEATTRSQAYGTLQQNINNEASAREHADNVLSGLITAEEEARIGADNTLRNSINSIIADIEHGYVYAGIATPSTTPTTGKVFYLALTAGTYTNFGATVVPQGINILKYNGSAWVLDSFLGLDDAPTQGSNNLVKSGGVLDSIIRDGAAFDLSAYNSGATYADLSAALTALNALPAAYKKGGMSVKFVQTSDNKYVQYRFTGTAITGTPNPFLNVNNWIGLQDATESEAGLESSSDKKISNQFPSIINGNERYNNLDLNSGVSITNGWYISTDRLQWINFDPEVNASVVDVSLFRGNTYKFTRLLTQYNRWGWLKSLNNINVLGGAADFCSGETLNVVDANSGNAEYSGIVPIDASYFYCCIKKDGIRIEQQLIIENNVISLDRLITENKNSLVDAINEVTIKTIGAHIDLSNGSLLTNGWFISTDYKFWTPVTEVAESGAVDISSYKGMKYTITRQISQPSRYCWLKSLKNVNVVNGRPDFCEGNTLEVINANEGYAIYSGIIPNDASYFYYGIKAGGSLSISTELTITDSGTGANEEIKNLSFNMQGGKLTQTGLPIGSLTQRDNFMKYWHTPVHIKCTAINSINLNQGEEYKVFCYNEQGVLIGTALNSLELMPGTKEVMIELSSQEEYAEGKLLNIAVTNYRGYTYLDYTKSTPLFLSYEVQVPLPVGENGLLSERHYDNGYVMLPPNYSPDGEPTPIAMFCHGSEGYQFGETSIPMYKDYLTYVCNSGYIVCDCNGKTDKYMLINGSVASDPDVEFCPIGIASRKGLYEMIVSHFNARQDGVYVFAKSMGGMMANLLGYLQPFKVRCVAALAPAIASIVETVRWMDAVEVDFCKSQLNISGTWPAIHHWSGTDAVEGKATILANLDKFLGFDPFFFGSDVDVADFVDKAFDYDLFQINQPTIWAKVNASHKNLPYPLKIWGAADDESVPFALWQMYKKMVDNTFGLCVLRVLPNGTGGHHAVDSSPLALQTTATPRYSSTQVTIPLAYAELIEWFNRW